MRNFCCLCILFLFFNQLTAQNNIPPKANYQLASRFSPKKQEKLLFSTAVAASFQPDHKPIGQLRDGPRPAPRATRSRRHCAGRRTCHQNPSRKSQAGIAKPAVSRRNRRKKSVLMRVPEFAILCVSSVFSVTLWWSHDNIHHH